MSATFWNRMHQDRRLQVAASDLPDLPNDLIPADNNPIRSWAIVNWRQGQLDEIHAVDGDDLNWMATLSRRALRKWLEENPF